ncbi:energy transducer TonB [Prevotella sp. oral taxon 317]|uniref:energy transducer TonB n=1 Tax=Prevotella sp. oral taxon 317 TaxID=652721 RepID=UPI001E44EE53|nr:energy transducer TonB [Prevotella sp. oral taxon 317]
MNNKQTPNLFSGFKCLLFAVLAITLAVLLVPARANAQDKKEKGKTTQTQKDTTTDDKVYEMCEQMPTYKGGEEAMMRFLSQVTRYPQRAQDFGIQGCVVVGFIVEKDGSLSDFKFIQRVDPELDDEALKTVKAMPKWNPGKHNGKNVRVRYSVPVGFKLI